MLFPAFPKNWDAEFKLHTDNVTTVEAIRQNGEMKILNVSPSCREKDIKRMDI